MIIVKLMGGLGNQMFQYAFGKNLALKNNTGLKLDVSYLEDRGKKENFTFRSFSLDVFKIDHTVASAEEINEIGKRGNLKIWNFLKLFLPFTKHVYLKEPFFHFFKKALSAPVNTYVDGYWQSEKYFKNIRKVLLEEFSPKNNLGSENNSLLNKITQCNSVSIHVRRGDYVSNAHIQSQHGTCSIEYYQKAMEKIRSKIPDPQFFVFSDDNSWVSHNIKATEPIHFVNNNKDENSYMDMVLMSKCRHNIIANSSFSWWAAWLNQNPGKIIVAPKKWFQDKLKNTKDLLPAEWIKI